MFIAIIITLSVFAVFAECFATLAQTAPKPSLKQRRRSSCNLPAITQILIGADLKRTRSEYPSLLTLACAVDNASSLITHF